MLYFPVSGVETYWWLPIAVAFTISLITSTGGISGAFLLLPFQMSVLHFTSPAVSSTNLIFNIVATPSGIYRYFKEKRMVWPLVWAVIIGTVPGVCWGAFMRVKYLSDPGAFKLFVGLVLLYTGAKLALDASGKLGRKTRTNGFSEGSFAVTDASVNFMEIGYTFNGEKYRARTYGISALSFIVGIISGIYGIGGGAIMAPLLVAIFGLPVYTIAGAALLGTFITSLTGVASYALIASFSSDPALIISPDWLLGAMFGIGGSMGMYIGARLQRYIADPIIKLILVLILLFIAAQYIFQFTC